MNKKIIYFLTAALVFAGINLSAYEFVKSFDYNGGSEVSYQSEIIDDPDIAGLDDNNGHFYLIQNRNIEIFDINSSDVKETRYLEDTIKGFGQTDNGWKYILTDDKQLKLYDPNFVLKDTHTFQDDVKSIVMNTKKNIAYVLTDGNELKEMQLCSDGTIKTRQTVNAWNFEGMLYSKFYDELILFKKNDDGNGIRLDFYKAAHIEDDCFKTLNLDHDYIVLKTRLTNSYIIVDDNHGIMVYDYSGSLVNHFYTDAEAIGLIVEKGGQNLIVRTPEKITKYSIPDGTKYWSHSFEDGISSMSLSPDGKTLFVLTDDGPGDDDSQLMSFDTNNGDKNWVQSFADNFQLVTCDADRVCVIDSSNLSGLEVGFTYFGTMTGIAAVFAIIGLLFG